MFVTMTATRSFCQVTYCHSVLLCGDSVAMPVGATVDAHKTSHSLILFVVCCM